MGSLQMILTTSGGWGDFHLTKRGKTQIKERAKILKKLDISFDIILSSPLLRATESAEIISRTLEVDMEIFELVKERNRNGILSGLEKKYALEKYPNEVKKLESNDYVLGSERIDDLILRIKEAVDYIKKLNYNNIIIVTHGNFLRSLTKEVLGSEIESFGDGGFILVEFSNRKPRILEQNLV